MSTSLISTKLRQQVFEVANYSCEYCLVPKPFLSFPLEIDYIIPEKQSGPTIFENLAACCKNCNTHKGVSVVGFFRNPNRYIPLFNPRKDIWANHFRLSETGEIIAKSEIGQATVNVLRLNIQRRAEARKAVLLIGAIKIDKR